MQIANKRIFSDYLKRFQLNKPSSKSFHGAASSSNNNLVDFNKDLILLHDSKVIVKERPTISLLESSDDWYEYINYTSQPLIVAFFASWCASCKITGPRVMKRINECEGKVKLLRVSHDVHMDLNILLQIYAIPTIFLLYQGYFVERLEGLQSEENLDKLFEQIDSLPKL